MAPDAEIPAFENGGEFPLQYFLDHDGHKYIVRYEKGEISVAVDVVAADAILFRQRIGGREDGRWKDEETTVYLTEIGRAILAKSLDHLRLPTLFQAQSHPNYSKGAQPLRPVGLVCGFRRDPHVPPLLGFNHHERERRRLAGIHDHDRHCLQAVPAREVAQWIAEHPEAHEAFRQDFPRMWEDYARLQACTVDWMNVKRWPDAAG
jgi:hypothetical protein